jgi:protein phosphatase PTC2/3
LNSQQVVDFVRRGIAEHKDLDELSEKLMDRCLAPDSDWGGIGCDNMTVLIVALLNGRTKSEWYDWIAERVQKGVGYPTPTEIPDPFKNGRPGLGGLRASGGIGRGAGGLPGSLASALSGNVIFRQSGDDESDFHHQIVYQTHDDESSEDEDEDESQGGRIHDITMEDESSTPTSQTSVNNDEIAHPAIRAEGYLDRSEDPTRTNT